MSIIMSSTCARRTCARTDLFRHAMPKRYLHRAPDRRYLELWKKQGVNYAKALSKETRKNLYNSPKLVEQILRASTVATLRGHIPFLHAAPAAAKLLMKMYEADHSSIKLPFFKFLRSPKSCEGQANLEKAKTWIPNAEFGGPYPGLLSQSYALTSGVRPLETAASWGFSNHGGRRQYFNLMDIYKRFLQETGIDRNTQAYDYFLAKGSELIRKYNRLKVGNFLVMGISKPDVARYVYDCKPYNVPTGKDAVDVAEHPERHTDTLDSEQTHMATTFLCKDTLTPNSGISIVDANDPDEVEAFCAGQTLTPMKDVEAFHDLVSPIPTAFESEQEEQMKKVDASMETLLAQFRSYRQTGVFDLELLKEPIEPLMSRDLPEQAI